MLIIGVDPGLGASPTGVALVRFDGLTPHLVDRWTLKSERGDWQTRCDAVLFRLSRLILPRRAELTALCYELSWVGENAQSALKLRDLGGGVRGLAVGFGLACIGVQPAESKRALAGDGRADKQQMIAAARQVFGVTLNEHEADAAAHALAGEAELRVRKLIARAG